MSEYVRRLRPRVSVGGKCCLSSASRNRRTVQRSDKVRTNGTNKRVRRASHNPSQLSECEVSPMIELPKKCFEACTLMGSEDPADNLGSKSPADNLGSKSPADNLGSKSPADTLGSKSPADNLGSKSPAVNLGSKSPAVNLGNEVPAVNLETKPKKKKRRITLSKSKVHGLLLQAGVADPTSTCLCLRAGISNGNISMEAHNPLEQILLESKCYLCSATVVVKLRDVLNQGQVGGSYWGGYDDDVICPNMECQENFVVSRMCTSRPELSDGKFYNHCEECPGFGKCIGDYRESHCSSCEEHYFAGSMGQFKCPTCYTSSEDEEETMGLFGPLYHKSSRRETPIFEYLYKEQETARFDEIIKESEVTRTAAFQYLLQDTASSGDDTLAAGDN